MSVVAAHLLGLSLGLSVPALDEGDDRYQFLVGLAEKDLLSQVVREGERFLSDFPRHAKAPLARYRLASALFDLDRLPEAAPHFSSLTKRSGFPFTDEVWFRHGQCQLEAGENAVAAFERVLGSDAEYLHAAATYLCGEAHFAQENFAGAAERYRATLTGEGTDDYAADALHGLTWCSLRLGEFDAVPGLARQFTQAHPNDPRRIELTFVTGEAHLEAGRAAEALAAFDSVTGGEFHAAALRGAGFACAALQDSERATQRFGALTSTYGDGPYAAEAYLHLGIHQLKTGRTGAALKSLGRCDAPEHRGEVAYWRGRTHTAREEHGKALASYEAGLALRPNEELATRLSVGRADALFDLGRTDEAAEVYSSAGSDYAMHAAAVAYLREGDPSAAIRVARPLLDEARGSAYRWPATLTAGEAFFALARYQPAEQAFLLVIGADKDEARLARAHSRLGWCRFYSGDHEGAREHFEGVLERYPASEDAAEARFMAGRCAEALADNEAAATHFAAYLESGDQGHAQEAALRLARFEGGEAAEERLSELLSENTAPELAPQAHYDLAERLAAREDWSTAVQHYRAVTERFPDSDLAPHARYGLAWSLYSLEQFAQSLAVCEALWQAEASDLRLASLELGVWAGRQAGQPAKSDAAFRALLSDLEYEPRRLAAARIAAAAWVDANELNKAESVFGTLLDQTRDPAVATGACVEGAYLALDLGNLDAAEARLGAAMKLLPGDAGLLEAWFFLGEARFEAGDDAKAALAYDRAAKSPEPVVQSRARYKGGFTYLRLERFDDAAQRFDQVPESSELHGESLFLSGEARYRAGRYEDAAEILDRFRKQAPRHDSMPKALFRLGVARVRLEQWQPGAQALTQLIQGHPDFEGKTEADLWRGRALVGLDQKRAARAAFERVAQADRGVLAAQAHIELGRLMLVTGERDEALSKFLYVSVLYASSEEVAEANFLAGQVLESRGEIGPAKERYQEAVKDHPEAAFTARCRRRLAELGDN